MSWYPVAENSPREDLSHEPSRHIQEKGLGPEEGCGQRTQRPLHSASGVLAQQLGSDTHFIGSTEVAGMNPLGEGSAQFRQGGWESCLSGASVLWQPSTAISAVA